MSEDILAAVKDPFALLRVQVEDEVGGVVGITVLIPDDVIRRDILSYSYLTGCGLKLMD